VTCDVYAVLIDDNADGHDGGRLVVCGSGGQTQTTNVYTSASSTIKVVMHRVVRADDDNVTGYNFLLNYEGQLTTVITV